MKPTLLLVLCLGTSAAAQTNTTTGGTPVVGVPGGTGSITSGTCSGTLFQKGVNSDGTIQCTQPTATIAPGSSAALGTVTTVQDNSTAVVDQAATSVPANGFSNVLASGAVCAGACDIMASAFYAKTDISGYFLPAKDGAADQYAAFPGQGPAIAYPRFSEDRRAGNRYWTSINSQPMTTSIYSDRTPFVFEVRTSNGIGYGVNSGALMLRQRLFGGGHNYPSVAGYNTTQKMNFAMLAIDSRVSSAGQGGGAFNLSAVHAAPGDFMTFTGAIRTMGYSEGEDEADKHFRLSLGTALDRWGGTLTATPALDGSSFGKFSLRVTPVSGYNNAEMAGEDMPLVNLSRIYSGSSADSIQTSIYPGFAKIAIADAATVVSTFGTSHLTTLTGAISNVTYDGNCPSTIVNTNPIVPDPMIVNEQGVGGRTVCAAFGSTAGMTAGDFIAIGGLHSNFELPRVVSVVDTTHAIINVQKYHGASEAVGIGGARGLALSLQADDIAPNTWLSDYGPQLGTQGTTLHKYFYVLGNDAQSLYVYFNGAPANELNTKAYISTSPTQAATLGTPVLTGTSLTSIPVNCCGGNYLANSTSNVAQGQTALSAPTVIIDPSGAACPGSGNKPTAHVNYVYALNVWGVTSVAIDTPGTCASVPAVALQTVWSSPYRLAPATVTTKTVDPATGSESSGYLLTDSIDPTKWQSGDLIEIPGWLHDRSGPGTRVFGKYFTGATSVNGFVGSDTWSGNYAYPDTLYGEINATPSLLYYPDATHPIGPGIAYEQPPNYRGVAGNFSTFWTYSTPPATSVITVGCTAIAGHPGISDPCLSGIARAYDLFNPSMNIPGVRTFNHHLRFDPTGTPGSEALSWDGPFTASTIKAGTLNVSTITIPAPSAGEILWVAPSGTVTPIPAGPIFSVLTSSGPTAAPSFQLPSGAPTAYIVYDPDTLSGPTVTTWSDQSGNNNTLTAEGTLNIVANAKGTHNAVQFDGSTTSLLAASSIPCTTSCTIEMLYKPGDVTIKHSFEGNTSGGKSLDFISDPNAKMELVHAYSVVMGGEDARTLTAGTWYRLAVTYSGGNVTTYLNGVASAVTTSTETPDPFQRIGCGTSPAGVRQDFANGLLGYFVAYPGTYNPAFDAIPASR